MAYTEKQRIQYLIVFLEALLSKPVNILVQFQKSKAYLMKQKKSF